MQRAWMSWSSGKDSALALHEVRRSGEVEVTGLLVTMNAAADRVAMHAVRRTLLEAQAAALGLPVHLVQLPWPCPNSEYEQLMCAAIDAALADGATAMVFGDLFLRDIRAYREEQLAGTGLTPLFPLWERPTAELAGHMIDVGIDAVITCVDPNALEASFAGRRFDASFLADLPPGVDPCGENGEFHTFVRNAPGFSRPVAADIGEVVERDGFVFCDVVPAATTPTTPAASGS
jgi:uncharacterized protein (TIGR00290 family)